MINNKLTWCCLVYILSWRQPCTLGGGAEAFVEYRSSPCETVSMVKSPGWGWSHWAFMPQDPTPLPLESRRGATALPLATARSPPFHPSRHGLYARELSPGKTQAMPMGWGQPCATHGSCPAVAWPNAPPLAFGSIGSTCVCELSHQRPGAVACVKVEPRMLRAVATRRTLANLSNWRSRGKGMSPLAGHGTKRWGKEEWAGIPAFPSGGGGREEGVEMAAAAARRPLAVWLAGRVAVGGRGALGAAWRKRWRQPGPPVAVAAAQGAIAPPGTPTSG